MCQGEAEVDLSNYRLVNECTSTELSRERVKILKLPKKIIHSLGVACTVIDSWPW